MHRRIAIHCKRRSAFLVGYANSRLPFYHRQIPFDRLLQPRFLQHHRMQRLRQASDFVERSLRNLPYFQQIGPQFGFFWRLIARPSQHRSHRSQDLPELIMKFARDITQRGFLGRNQRLRQITALLRKRRQLIEQYPVAANQIKAREDNRDQRSRKKVVRLPLYVVVNLRDLRRRAIFALIVLDQHLRDSRTQRRQPCLQRQPYLLPRFFFLFLAPLRQSERAVNRVPELRQRTLQILLLVRCSSLRRNLLLVLESIVQIAAHALKLRLPRSQRIRLLIIHQTGVEHVAHRDADRIQFVLNAQQLQRVFAVAVNQIALQFAQAGDAPGHISRVPDHRRQRNHQPDVKWSCRRSPRRLPHRARI